MRRIDVFVGDGAKGNPAGVVLLDGSLDEAEMQVGAREIGLPATAFIQEGSTDGAHDVRWFAPQREIALCGHGALAAGHVMLSQVNGDSVTFRTGDSRLVEVRKLGKPGRYELALPAIPTRPHDLPDLEAVIGCKALETRWNDQGYALAVLESAGDVRAIEPDLAAMQEFGTAQIIVTADSDDPGFDIVSRVFSGGVEDSATGSAHAVLAPYWSARLGGDALSAYQASERGGRITCRMDGDRVWLGGEVREAAS